MLPVLLQKLMVEMPQYTSRNGTLGGRTASIVLDLDTIRRSVVDIS